MIKKLFLFIAFGLILANFALAHTESRAFWMPGDPIVPCGLDRDNSNASGLPADYYKPCNYCQLLHLTRHLIDFILIAASPVLATLFFIIAGIYMMLGGSNPGMLAQGKRMFKDTFIGLLIVMLSWLFVNSILNTLVTDSEGAPVKWYEFQCTNLL